MVYIFGTAGHIDHGKTTLVKILSGVECDTLREEKERGITIQLGFANMHIGTFDISIIDVPGHEKFVKTMVAGVSGIDAVLFVISAAEGIMPQTVEHLDIISLLDIQNVIVVLTKLDCVDKELCELIKSDIREFFALKGYPHVPILCVSSVTGEGIPQLLNAMESVVAHDDSSAVENKTPQAYLSSIDMHHITPSVKPLFPFRLPLDRVFTVKGHGTVVTGTSMSGNVTKNDVLMVYPQKKLVRVKNVQRHNQNVLKQESGVRTALNLHGIAYTELQKGDVIATPDSLECAQHWEVLLYCLPHSPSAIKNRAKMHIHHQTKEVIGCINCIGTDAVEPGEFALCNIYFEKPMVGVALDRCIIRGGSPLVTMGGCIVLNPLANRLAHASKKNTTCEEQMLLMCLPESLSCSSFQNVFTPSAMKKMTLPSSASMPQLKTKQELLNAIIALRLRLAKEQGLSLRELSLLTACSVFTLQEYMPQVPDVVCIGQTHYLDAVIIKKYKEYVTIWITEQENLHPLRKGVPLAELYTSFHGRITKDTLDYIIHLLVTEGIIYNKKEYVCSTQYKTTLSPKQEALKTTILHAIEVANTTPPSVAELSVITKASTKDVLTMLSYLCNEGLLVRVSQELYYSSERINEIQGLLLSFFSKNKVLTLADFKHLLGGISRKYIVPLLEYFDSVKFTRRENNTRSLL